MWPPHETNMDVKQLCTKNPTSKIITPPLENLVPRRIVVHHHPPSPPWKRQRKRQTAAITWSGRAPLHTMMLFEPMNRTAASDEIETLWHIGQWSSPWSPDPGAVNFIWCSRRRGTTPHAIIHAPNCKTPNTTAAADAIATHDSVKHRPADMNLIGSIERREN
jgi:hypothetical protein